jgi:hypothetical protein
MAAAHRASGGTVGETARLASAWRSAAAPSRDSATRHPSVSSCAPAGAGEDRPAGDRGAAHQLAAVHEAPRPPPRGWALPARGRMAAAPQRRGWKRQARFGPADRPWRRAAIRRSAPLLSCAPPGARRNGPGSSHNETAEPSTGLLPRTRALSAAIAGVDLMVPHDSIGSALRVRKSRNCRRVTSLRS